MSSCQDDAYPLLILRRLLSIRFALWKSDRGLVVAMVALFLPVAVLMVGLVADVAAIFAVRRVVQGSCDLGALAGVQELDWDALYQGQVLLRLPDAEQKALDITRANLETARPLVSDVELVAKAQNPSDGNPILRVEARFSVRMVFLRWLEQPSGGIWLTACSEASVLARTKW